MKYLVHLRPPIAFSNRVDVFRERIIGYITGIPGQILHCTLMAPYAKKEDEEEILWGLDNIRGEPFDIETGRMELFDKSSLVIRMKEHPGLIDLHQKVIDSLNGFVDHDETPGLDRAYADDEQRVAVYNQYGSPYYGEFFNPHMTIAAVNPLIIRPGLFDEGLFAGRRWIVDSFYISRKEGGGWKTVRRFLLDPTTQI